MSQLSRNLRAHPDCPIVQGRAAQTPPRPLLQPQGTEGTPASVPAPREPKLPQGQHRVRARAGLEK